MTGEGHLSVCQLKVKFGAQVLESGESQLGGVWWEECVFEPEVVWVDPHATIAKDQDL